MSAKKRRLMREWAIHAAAQRQETLKVYNETVARGSKQTYSEFMEELRQEWLEEMMKK